MKTNTLTRRRQQRQLTDAPLAQPVPAPVAQKSVQPSALTQPPAPVPASSAVDAIRAAVTGGTPGSGRPDSAPDVQRVGDAIRGGSTRRTVIRSAVWSVPVIAAATAAPAFAASPPFCAACSGARPPQCIISGAGNGGTCQCPANLVCVGTGPLRLANVCVGSTLVTTTCGTNPGGGAASCFGVCLTDGGVVVTALQTFVADLRVTLTAQALDGGLDCTATVTGGIPTNICVSPVAQDGVGDLGALCLTSPGASGTISGTISDLLTTLRGVLNGANLGPAASCSTGYTCQPGANATLMQPDGTACSNGIGQLNLTIGFCACSPVSV